MSMNVYNNKGTHKEFYMNVLDVFSYCNDDMPLVYT